MLLLLTLPLFAQRASVVVRELDADQPGALASLLRRRLESELSDRSYELFDLGEQSIGGVDATEFRIGQLDLGEIPSDLDLVVAAFYRTEDDAVVVQFVLIDAVVDIVVGGVLSRQRLGLTIATAVDSAIEDLVPGLERWERDQDLLRRGPPADKVERIFVFGEQEDVRVRFAELEVGTIQGGQLLVPFSPYPIGSVIPLTLQKAGYHSQTVEVALEARRVETEIPRLTAASSIGLSVLWTSSYVAGAGLGVRYYVEPDLFYVLGEHYRVFGGGDGPRDVWSADSRIAIGLYMAPPQSLLRPYGEFGGGFIQTDLEAQDSRLRDDPLYLDFYTGVAVGLELSLGRLKPFVRAEVDYALGVTVNNLLGNRWLSPPVTALQFPVPMITLGVQRTW
jgi:hypothetical protein